MQYLEATYYITAGPLLLIVLIYGLKSLRLTKEVADNAERRASLTSTAERVHYFCERISPMFDNLDTFATGNKLTWFGAYDVGLDDDGEVFVAAKTELDGEVLGLELKTMIDHFLPALNALSAWCSYFVNQVADERIAYKTLAADFLFVAEKCIPLILIGEKQKAHADLLTLYQIWRSRIEEEAIAEAKVDLDARLHDLRRGASPRKTA
jgi:hypothetical protein